MYKLTLLLSLLVCFAARSQDLPALEKMYGDSAEPVKLRALIKFAKANFVANRPLAHTAADKAMAIAKQKTTYLAEEADLTNFLGIISMYDEKYAEAEKYLTKALQMANENNLPVIKQKALLNMALSYSRQGDYQKSIQANFALLPMLRNGTDRLMLANSLANVSNAYSYLNQFTESNQYQLEALALFEALPYPQGIANAYNTLGANYTHQKNYAKAISYLSKSAAMKEKTGDNEGLANAYINLSTLHHAQQNYAESYNLLRKSEAIYQRIKNNKGLMKVYTNLGVHFAALKDYEKAKAVEEKAVALAATEKDEYLNADLYRNLSKSYASLNDASKAYEFSSKAYDSKDSLTKLSVQKQIAEMQVRFETERKERLVKEQQLQLSEGSLQLAQSKLQIAKRNNIIAGGVALAVVALLLGYFLYRRYKWKAEVRMQAAVLKQQEMATRAVLEAEETERQRIAKDLHDGVGQMMSAAKMNLSAYEHHTQFSNPDERIRFERIIQLVDESCNEVRAVSHNMMPNALLKNSLAAAIREFINKLDNRQLAAHLYTEGLDERLDTNVETVLYRVIQECVNNVIKHAGASTLDISIIKDPTEITVTIEDNGKGFDATDKQKTAGIGLKNIYTRMAYLKGTMELDSTPGRGTLVALHVPLAV